MRHCAQQIVSMRKKAEIDRKLKSEDATAGRCCCRALAFDPRRVTLKWHEILKFVRFVNPAVYCSFLRCLWNLVTSAPCVSCVHWTRNNTSLVQWATRHFCRGQLVMWEVTFNLLFVNNGDVILRYEFLFSCVTLTTAKNQRKRGRTKHIVPILCSEAESKQILEEVAKNGSEQSTCICRDPLLKISRIFLCSWDFSGSANAFSNVSPLEAGCD